MIYTKFLLYQSYLILSYLILSYLILPYLFSFSIYTKFLLYQSYLIFTLSVFIYTNSLKLILPYLFSYIYLYLYFNYTDNIITLYFLTSNHTVLHMAYLSKYYPSFNVPTHPTTLQNLQHFTILTPRYHM